MKKIYCGAAKAKITPAIEELPNLYGLMHSHFAGVTDDLFVRVLYLNNGVNKAFLIGWDLDKAPVPKEIIPMIAGKFDVPEENIMYFAVHTHTAPLHSARMADGPNAKHLQKENVIKATVRYEEFLKEKVLQAAQTAVTKAQPCRIGYGLGESYIGENRVQDYNVENEDGSVSCITALGSNPKGPCDRSLFVMKVESLEGEPVAFLVNHAVHCCVMFLNNFNGKGGVGISGDIAGKVSAVLEEKFEGSVAIWSSAAAGDINPIMMNQINYADFMTGAPKEYTDIRSDETAHLMLMILASRQAADAVDVIRKINCAVEDGEIAGNIQIITTQMRAGVHKVMLQGLRIGEMAFCGISGELFNTLGRNVKEIGNKKFENTVVINHNRSLEVESGYIFDDDALNRCLREDGSRQGLPNIKDTIMDPGLFPAKLAEGAAKYFEKL